MVLWWIGNLVLLAVVIPVVLTLMSQLLAPASEIKRYADDTLEHGVLLIAALDSVDDLVETRDLAREASSLVQRYGRALEQAL